MSGHQDAAGWYRRPDGSVAWWDGTAWASPPPGQSPTPGGAQPTEVRRVERIRWAGISWGSGSAALNVGVGVLLVLLGLPGAVFALFAGSVAQGLFIALFAVVMLACAPVFFINAHFCRELERRRLHHHSPATSY